jgi:hypothetical protein
MRRKPMDPAVQRYVDAIPEADRPLEGFAPQQECVGGAQTFGVVLVEGLVERQGHDVVARTLIVAVNRDDVADDQLAHGAPLMVGVESIT